MREEDDKDTKSPAHRQPGFVIRMSLTDFCALRLRSFASLREKKHEKARLTSSRAFIIRMNIYYSPFITPLP
jgi:hypothetical protein